MGSKSTLRAIQAAERRRERDAQKRLRELDRQAREQAKLSAIEQARLEVETFENRLEVLLSVHKEQSEVWDWLKLATALPPHSPRKISHHETKFRLRTTHQTLEEAWAEDEREFQEALQNHSQEFAEWERMKAIARRILTGDHKAYKEALTEFSALAEISDLGSAVHFTVHNAKLIECNIKVNGPRAIPTELKSLTSTGKVSVKPMPKGRFHEIYQDYVCSCVLRVAREIFGLLPTDGLLVTASVDALDSRTGRTTELPVLSVAISRAQLALLDFEHLDPSDALENFPHRGDAKASRKSGEFESIIPLTSADLQQQTSSEIVDFQDLLPAVRRIRNELKTEIEELSPASQQTMQSL